MIRLRIVITSALFLCWQQSGYSSESVDSIPESTFRDAFGDKAGAFVMIDVSNGKKRVYREDLASARFPPCSTFKIWNTLIGAETGHLSAAGQAFYQWDGVERFLPEWNKDLTLAGAFQVSCVPAFQNLARKIGEKSMRDWLDRIGYGDRDISAGLDVFWLPAEGRKTILVSANEQAELMVRLADGKLPFKQSSVALLRDVMKIRQSGDTVLYGKTGSGTLDQEYRGIGWFVGYATRNERSVAFACVVLGDAAAGKDARALVENILGKSGLPLYSPSCR